MLKNANIIIVPDVSASELSNLLLQEQVFTSFDQSYKDWDFYTDNNGKRIQGRGCKFAFHVWKPDWTPRFNITTEVAKERFNPLGYHGHVGAFLQWIRNCQPRGHFASLLEDGACFNMRFAGLCMPCYARHGIKSLKLGFKHIKMHWIGQWQFVGFRRVD